MMKVSKVIGDNIQKLMVQQNISYRKLSEVIGVSHPTLKKYVDGEQPIDSEKLMQIALFFNKSFDYFLREKPSEVEFMFRADKPNQNVKNIDLENLKLSINSYLDVIGKNLYRYIPQKYKIDISDFKSNKKSIFKQIEKIAYDQRRIANIESIIPDNYFEVLENIGINIIARDFNNDSYFGASSFSNDVGSFILVNDSNNIPEERKIFSLIHEYAHLLFHSDQYTNDDYNAYYINGKYDYNEKIANKFAGYFLVPRYMVDSYVNSQETVDAIEMKQYFKVSIQTLYVMLYEYGLIPKNVYQDFWRKVNQYGYKKVEPNPIDEINIEDKNNRLIKRIKELFHNEEISANKVSEVLGLDTINTRQMLKSWRKQDERYLQLK